jgi:transcriptional regulator with XRE-family HTH domain
VDAQGSRDALSKAHEEGRGSVLFALRALGAFAAGWGDLAAPSAFGAGSRRNAVSYADEGQVRRLQDLLAYPRESLDIELKSWLDLSQGEDAANLAKAVLALANHGGGYVLLGFVEESGDWRPAEGRPGGLGGYDQDRVNGIVHHYADPPFQCEVHHVRHPANGELFPVIVVPGGHSVPIRAKCEGPNGKHVRQHAYYIRRPGPRSEEPRSAREWDSLIRRCMTMDKEGLLDAIRAILAGAEPTQRGRLPEDTLASRLSSWTNSARSRWAGLVRDELAHEQPSRYIHGTWDVGYAFANVSRAPSLKELLSILEEVQGHESGWPPWWVATRETIAPHPYDGLVECWFRDSRFSDAAHSDFWRASPDGMMFLLRGYEHDGGGGPHRPGTVLDPVIAVWRMGECLLHAARLAERLAGESTEVLFRAQWRGLKGRELQWTSGRAFGPHLGDGRVCQQDAVNAEVVARSETIGDALPELVGALVSPLCEAFQFYVLPPRIIQRELAQMRGSA